MILVIFLLIWLVLSSFITVFNVELILAIAIANYDNCYGDVNGTLLCTIILFIFNICNMCIAFIMAIVEYEGKDNIKYSLICRLSVLYYLICIFGSTRTFNADCLQKYALVNIHLMSINVTMFVLMVLMVFYDCVLPVILKLYKRFCAKHYEPLQEHELEAFSDDSI